MEKTKQKQITDFLINNGVIIVMFILVIVAGLTTQNFFTLNNLNNLLNNMSFRLVIALGIAGCVITAGCDLSAGRLIGLGGCISDVLLQRMDYSGKVFPGYAAFECISGSFGCNADLCSIRNHYWFLHCLFKCTAVHRNAGYHGDCIWSEYAVHKRNPAWWLYH